MICVKRNVNVFAFLLLLIFISALLPVSAFAEDAPRIVSSGECGADGNNVTWTLDSEGTLRFVGQGAIKDYAWWGANVSPWYYNNGNNVKNAIFGEGITHLGKSLLEGCKNLYSITIPASVNSIHCVCPYSSLQVVYYAGSRAQKGKILFYNNAFGENDILMNAKWYYEWSALNFNAIHKITPESGSLYVPSSSISLEWNLPVKQGQGDILVKDINTDAVISKISISSSRVKFNNTSLSISDLFQNDDFGPVRSNLYLEFEDGTILDDAGISLGRISTKSAWYFRTLPIQTWGFRNLDSNVRPDLYAKLFPHFIAEILWSVELSSDDKGQCYGMADSAACVTTGYPSYKSFQEDVLSLSGIKSPDVRSAQIQYETARYFIGMCYLLQFYPHRLLQESQHRDDLVGLCNAVKAFKNGTGLPVIIGIEGSAGNHVILAADIIEVKGGYKIYAHDSNEPLYLDCIDIHEGDNGLTWEISCENNTAYSVQISSQLSDSISYEIHGPESFAWLTVKTPPVELRYNLLMSNLESFLAKNKAGSSANVSTGTLDDTTSEEFIIPIDGSHTSFNSSTTGNNAPLYWVMDNSPLTIQGVGNSNRNTTLAGEHSKISISSRADTEITLLPQKLDEGGNIIQICPQDTDRVKIESSYLDNVTEESTQEHTISIEGLASNEAKIIEGAYGTEIHGFSDVTISVDVNGKSENFSVRNLEQDNIIFVSMNTSDENSEVMISADTTHDGMPDTSLETSASSNSERTLPNTGVSDHRGIYAIVFLISSLFAAWAYLERKRLSREAENH